MFCANIGAIKVKPACIARAAISISGNDYEKFKGKLVRLKGLYNITLGKKPSCTGDLLIKDMPKIQWVSFPNILVKIIGKEGTLEGIGEPEMASLKTETIIQMERIGFGRVDNNNKKEIIIYLAHK